jgi:hypothetical protein
MERNVEDLLVVQPAQEAVSCVKASAMVGRVVIEEVDDFGLVGCHN